jgi:hypothetical protein
VGLHYYFVDRVRVGMGLQFTERLWPQPPEGSSRFQRFALMPQLGWSFADPFYTALIFSYAPRTLGRANLDMAIIGALGAALPVTRRIKFSLAIEVPYAFYYHRTLGLVGLTVLFPAPSSARFQRGPGWSRRWRALLVAGAVTLAVAGPWYGRLVAWTGNPLFPFLPDLFGESAWDPMNFRTFASLTASDLPPEPPASLTRYAGRLVSLARLPWDVVFARHRYGQQPPYSPVYLAALPLALLLAWRDSRLRLPLLIAGIYAYVCLGLPPDSRYLLPILPLVSLAAGAVLAWVLVPVPPRYRPWLAIALCAVCFLPAWCYGIYRINRQGPVPVTAVQREAYLSRRLPLYPAVAHLNRRYGAAYTVYGLWAEEMIYYADGRFLGDWYGPASYRQVLRNVRNAEGLHRSLRRNDVGFLLVATGRQRLPVPEDAAFHRLFRQVYADPDARVFELLNPPG